PRVAAAAEVAGEEDHAGKPSSTDHPRDLVGDPPAGEAGDEALARELVVAELAGDAGAVASVGKRDPDGCRNGPEAQERNRPPPPEDQLPVQANIVGPDSPSGRPPSLWFPAHG